MRYVVVVQDKDKNLTKADVEAESTLAALIVGEQYVFGMNGGKIDVPSDSGYSVIAVIGEHPLINTGGNNATSS